MDVADNFCADFIVIPLVFYIIVAAAGLDLGELRRDDWLFDLGSTSQARWYEFYSYLGMIRALPLSGTLLTLE